MTISPELLAAYADGELGGDAAREVEAKIAANPELQAVLDAHLDLRSRLAAHFAPIAAEPVPDSLREIFADGAVGTGVTVLATEARKRRPSVAPRWAWIALPALAASLALAFLGIHFRSSGDYADGVLADALDRHLVADQKADAPLRILLSFRDGQGQFCRGYSGTTQSGIACRDDRGWRLTKHFGGTDGHSTEYRQAGSADPAVMAAIQDMAAGAALDAGAEAEAARRGWRPALAR